MNVIDRTSRRRSASRGGRPAIPSRGTSHPVPTRASQEEAAAFGLHVPDLGVGSPGDETLYHLRNRPLPERQRDAGPLERERRCR
ncbi:MAG TPA: hypothetical protein VIM86_01650, partial [Thermodesulfobacteriota bacterium]